MVERRRCPAAAAAAAAVQKTFVEENQNRTERMRETEEKSGVKRG